MAFNQSSFNQLMDGHRFDTVSSQHRADGQVLDTTPGLEKAEPAMVLSIDPTNG